MVYHKCNDGMGRSDTGHEELGVCSIEIISIGIYSLWGQISLKVILQLHLNCSN